MYGVPDIPEKFKNRALRVKTPVRGLYLTGSDVCSCGIGGALMGGVGAASLLNGPFGFFRIGRKVGMSPSQKRAKQGENEGNEQGVLPATGRQPLLSNQKLPAVLVAKVQVTETVYELVFELPLEPGFEPGQYARVLVGNYEWRDYSIVELWGRRVTFLIDTRFKGEGSKFVSALAPGDKTFMRIPAGDFTIATPEHAHIFVATGTGISPFIPMIGKLTRGRVHRPSNCFSGADSSATPRLPRKFKRKGDPHTVCITVCVSRETPSESMRRGRVTDAIRTRNFDTETTDFYICGNPSMIDDTMKILLEKGSRNIYQGTVLIVPALSPPLAGWTRPPV